MAAHVLVVVSATPISQVIFLGCYDVLSNNGSRTLLKSCTEYFEGTSTYASDVYVVSDGLRNRRRRSIDHVRLLLLRVPL